MIPQTPEEEPGNGLSGSPRGRRPKLDARVTHAIRTMLEAGATPAAAAPAAGIRYETFLNWMRWGQESRRGIYSDFFKEMQTAIATNRVTTEAQIKQKDPLSYAKHVWRKEPEWAPLQEKLDIGVTHGIDSELEQAFSMLVEAEVASRLRKGVRQLPDDEHAVQAEE